MRRIAAHTVRRDAPARGGTATSAQRRATEPRGLAHAFVEKGRTRLDAFVRREARSYSASWWKHFARSLGMGVALLIFLHFLLALAFAQHPVVRSAVLAVTVTAALLLTGALVWAYWRARFMPDDARPHIVTVVLGCLAAVIALEAFASAQLLLWRSGSISAVAGVEPSLWRVEALYLWHLLDAIPLLDVADTLALTEPRVFADGLSGALLLTFKIFVLLPLIRLTIAAYVFAETEFAVARGAARRHAQAASRRVQSALHATGPFDGAALMDLRKVAAVVWLWALIAFGLVWLFLEPGSLGAQTFDWLLFDLLLPREVEVLFLSIPMDWLADLLAILVGPGVAVVAFFIGFIVLETIDDGIELPEPSLQPWRWSLLLAGVVACVTAVIVGLTVLAARVDLSSAADDGSEPLWVSSLAFLVWHVLAGVPGLDIPETLGWTLAVKLDGHVLGAVLLMYKAIVLFTIAFAAMRIVRPRLHAAQGARAALPCVAEYGRLASEIAERLAAAGAEMAAKQTRLYRPSADEQTTDLMIKLARTEAEVHAIFGDARPTGFAAAVLEHLREWNEALDEWSRNWVPDEEAKADFARERDAHRDRVLQDLRRYWVAARHEMQRALDDGQRATRTARRLRVRPDRA